MLNIVFGSIKKIAPAAIQQFDFPSMKVEKNRGKGTTRRVLFNKSACRLLELDAGGVQELLFGFAQPQQENEARLFVVNTAEFIKEVEDKTYKVSKNYAAYDDSKEKGKSISSTQLCNEIRQFVAIGDATDTDYEIVLHDESGEAPIYELVKVVDAPAIEVNCDDCEDECESECPAEDEPNEELSNLIAATEDFDEEEEEDDEDEEDEDEDDSNSDLESIEDEFEGKETSEDNDSPSFHI
tara:strand:+ start:1611 stop:2330 length:720 start_codon:yes stop_codon:yes gene_type:complete